MTVNTERNIPTMQTDTTHRPKVLAYYFPSWHKDAQNAQWFGPGWDEWELLRAAKPRFAGHRQPRIPAHGYYLETDPFVAEQHIDLAVQHGVDGFLVDFYWYEDGGYLQAALDEGLLKASNRDQIEIAIMWANHELVDIFPLDEVAPSEVPVLKRGAVDRATFERMATHVISNYFSQPNYLRVEGKPWFSIYEIGRFVEGMGGLAEAADALAWFRDAAIAAGHPGLHIDAVVWGFGVLPEAVTVKDPATIVRELGFDSATSYVWIHHVDLATQSFPQGDFAQLQKETYEDYERLADALPVPFYPNVTVGWDASPRTGQGELYRQGDYPWTSVWDATPAEFRSGLVAAKEFVEARFAGPSVITINAWNEWTEGSSLLPDTHNGLGFLEAIRDVFGVPRR